MTQIVNIPFITNQTYRKGGTTRGRNRDETRGLVSAPSRSHIGRLGRDRRETGCW